jgi:hypothetical protein
MRLDEPHEIDALHEAVDRLSDALAPLTARWRQIAGLYSRAAQAGQIPAEPFDELRRAVDRVRRMRGRHPSR